MTRATPVPIQSHGALRRGGRTAPGVIGGMMAAGPACRQGAGSIAGGVVAVPGGSARTHCSPL